MNNSVKTISSPIPIDNKALLDLNRGKPWDTLLPHRLGGSDHEASISETSGDFNDEIRRIFNQPQHDEKRAIDYHDKYQLSPLRVHQFQGGRAAFKQEVHTPWVDAINNTPANAGRIISRESGQHPSYLRWLDKYNAEMHGRPNSIPVTEEELKNDPHLARILAGFALQDHVQEEVIEHGSNKVPNTYTSAWAQKPAPAKPRRGLFGRAVNKVKGWFGRG